MWTPLPPAAPPARRYSRAASAAMALGVALLAACSGDDGVAPDPAIAFMVGTWDAAHFELTPDAAPDQSLDLVTELGATFTLNVQPSGYYTATLTLPGVASPPPETGQLEVEGNELVFNRSTPSPATSRATYAEPTSGRVIFTGPTEFDLNGDQVLDDVTLEVELVRR